MSREMRKRLAHRSLCSFQLEKSFGDELVIGLDEVGRGCIAGPVVAAGVVFDPKDYDSQEPLMLEIDDSKRFSAARREQLVKYIFSRARSVQWSFIDSMIVDEINILQASFAAFREVIQKTLSLPLALTRVMVDGNQMIPDCSLFQKTVISGDRISKSIAAASLVAKVLRDRWMKTQSEIYPHYGFDRHKGYGTAAHWAAIELQGPCEIHRRSFLKKFYSRKESGEQAEGQVLEFYRSKGLELRHQNWSCDRGEIDLIFESGNEIRFVEVRFRSDGNLEAAFPLKKQERFKELAFQYLRVAPGARKRPHLDFVFVSPNGIETFEDFLKP